MNHANTPGFLAPGGEEFNLGPETRLDCSELLCNKVLLKYKEDRMVEINESERIKEKRIKRNEDNLRELQDNFFFFFCFCVIKFY